MGDELMRLTRPAEDTDGHRKMVVEALRDLAAERGDVSAADKRADPQLAAYVIEQAKDAVRAANAAAAGMPEPFYRGEWRRPSTRTVEVNHCCLWCGNATVSERLAWIHGMRCRYRPRSGAGVAAQRTRGGIT